MSENIRQWTAEQWAKHAEELARECSDIPDRGAEFAESARDRLFGIADTIRKTGNATADQCRAIGNLEGGIRRWTERG